MAQRRARTGTATRKTSASKTGSGVRVTSAARKKATAGDLSPVDYMLAILRDETQSRGDRMDAAKAAAPYLHARLSGVKHSGELAMRHEDALNELDDARKTNPPQTSR
jgi:hypothetical protein